MKFFLVLNQFYMYIPKFSNLKLDNTLQESTCQENVACCVCGYNAAVGKLLACERELKTTAGTYCGSKETDDLMDTKWKVAMH